MSSLLRFGYLITGSHHAAEDAVQTALTQGCAKWPSIRRADDPDVYVRRMVINAHISAWRRVGRRESSVVEVRDHASPDPAGPVVVADAAWRVCSALPRQQRAAVVLRYYEDREYAEIAHLLDITESAARSHVHRALAALRKELTRQEAADG